MSSTNKTTNYNLSQYIGSDKPTYLGDYNSDMQKIDTALKNNADNIQAVGSTASTASENANTALENAETARNTANSANTNAGNAQNTATQALQKSLQNESDIQKFNLTKFKEYNRNNIILSRGNLSNPIVNTATNEDGTIGKIYGSIYIGNTSGNEPLTIKLPNSDFRPSENINISGICLRLIFTSNGINDITLNSILIKTNGDIEITLPSNSSINAMRCIFIASLLFIKNFGDTDIQPD